MSAPATTEEQSDDDPIFDLEPIIHSLRQNISIMGHLAISPDVVTPDQWLAVRSSLSDDADEIYRLWHQLFDQWMAERQAHKAVLAAAKAETAAPGSPADLRHAKWLWGILRNVGSVVIDECDRADPEKPAETKP